MVERTTSLDVAIADGKIVSADLSPALAETVSVTAGAAVVIAETNSVEAGLHLRIVTEGTKLLSLNANIEDEWYPWENAVALSKRDSPCVRHLDIGQSIKALLLQKTGLPKTFTWHREEGVLVPCTPISGCPQCDAKLPRRTFTVLNVYEFEDRAVRLLVCDERLTIAAYAVIANRAVDVAKCPLAFHNRTPSEYPTTRENAYEVKILPELLPDELAVIEAMEPIDPTTISAEVLVGGLF